METVPQLIGPLQPPADRLGVGERRLLPLVVLLRRLEVEHLIVLLGGESLRRRFDGALVPAELALHGSRDVHAAQLLDGVVTDIAVEECLPRVGEGPESGGYMGAHRGALRPRRAFTRAAVHLLLHALVHLVERDVADAVLTN